MLFNVRIGNRDDHLRNHGFIRVKTGWRLAPAYDINPNPYKAAHTLTLDGYTTEPDVGAAMACAELYRVNDSEARKILQEIDAALGDWQLTASQLGLARSDIARMAAVIQN